MTTTQSHDFEDRLRKMTPVAAPASQQAAVEEVSRMLGNIAHAPAKPQCRLIGPKGETIAMPESVFLVLERIVEVMARGDSVTVVPVGKEMTTQQAADLLNVSRQYVVRLLEEGEMPFTKTGKHRRMRIEDVLSFKEQRDAKRRSGLQKLTSLTEELGGYDAELKK